MYRHSAGGSIDTAIESSAGYGISSSYRWCGYNAGAGTGTKRRNRRPYIGRRTAGGERYARSRTNGTTVAGGDINRGKTKYCNQPGGRIDATIHIGTCDGI